MFSLQLPLPIWHRGSSGHETFFIAPEDCYSFMFGMGKVGNWLYLLNDSEAGGVYAFNYKTYEEFNALASLKTFRKNMFGMTQFIRDDGKYYVMSILNGKRIVSVIDFNK